MDAISLLRSPPYVLDHKQQLAFSTLSHLLENSLSQRAFQLEFMQSHSGKGDDELSITERNEMLASVWATVSTLYFVDKICGCEASMLGLVYEKTILPDFAQSSAKLRNAKDHLAQRIGNFAKSQSLPPINGLVRWTFNPRLEAGELVFNVQIFTVDPMVKGFSVSVGEGIDGPIRAFDHLALFAFDDCLQVSRAHDALQDFIELLNEHLTAAFDGALCDGAPKKTQLSEAEQRPFCVFLEARMPRLDLM